MCCTLSRVYVFGVPYCIISVLIDELYAAAAGLVRIDYRLLASYALLFPPKLTLSRSRFVCFFFLCFPPRLCLCGVVSKIYASSSESSSQSQPFLGALSRDDPTGIGFSPPLFAMLLCVL